MTNNAYLSNTDDDGRDDYPAGAPPMDDFIAAQTRQAKRLRDRLNFLQAGLPQFEVTASERRDRRLIAKWHQAYGSPDTFASRVKLLNRLSREWGLEGR